jgi:hypothetical protein
MATRWMRWNPASKILEHSTDSGANWAALPLNASVLNEGAISDALLSANIARRDQANVLTHARPLDISSAQPVLDLNESDQAADARRMRLTLDGGSLRVQNVNDAYDAFTERLALARSGALSLSPSGSNIVHELGGGISGTHAMRLRNTSNAAANSAQYIVGNDSDAQLGDLIAFASGFTPAGSALASGVAVRAWGAGGLSLAAQHASGATRIYSGGAATPRLTLTAGGEAQFSGAIKERGWSTPIGEWQAHTYAAGNYIGAESMTWTVEAGDVRGARYSRIGKTVHYTTDILNSTVGGTVSTMLRIVMPDSLVGATYAFAICKMTYGGTEKVTFAYTIPGLTHIHIANIPWGNHILGTNNVNLQLSMTFEVQ